MKRATAVAAGFLALAGTQLASPGAYAVGRDPVTPMGVCDNQYEFIDIEYVGRDVLQLAPTAGGMNTSPPGGGPGSVTKTVTIGGKTSVAVGAGLTADASVIVAGLSASLNVTVTVEFNASTSDAATVPNVLPQRSGFIYPGVLRDIYRGTYRLINVNCQVIWSASIDAHVPKNPFYAFCAETETYGCKTGGIGEVHRAKNLTPLPIYHASCPCYSGTLDESQPPLSNPYRELRHVWTQPGGWYSGSIPGMNLNAISSVNMGGQWPQTMALKDGVLRHIYGDTSGWHDASTGISGLSAISAVNMGGAWPQVMALKNGVLHQIYGDTSGWHIASTGISGLSAISAVNMGGSWPQVMAVKNGVLHQIYANTSGWQIGSTGISGVGAISAVNMGGSWPQVMAVKNGVLHQIYANTSGWQIGSTGISGVGAISAVNMGGSWPQVMAVKNGVLHQIYGDTSGWHDGSLAISANQPAAVNMGAAWPQVMVLK